MDYVCPFCFLVENAIEELKRDRDVKVRIRPFELRPDPVPTLRPRGRVPTQGVEGLGLSDG